MLSVLELQRELWHPKMARKVSGLLRNGPLVLILSQVTLVVSCTTAEYLFSSAEIHVVDNEGKMSPFAEVYQSLTQGLSFLAQYNGGGAVW